jgi:hypothetical protein
MNEADYTISRRYEGQAERASERGRLIDVYSKIEKGGGWECQCKSCMHTYAPLTKRWHHLSSPIKFAVRGTEKCHHKPHFPVPALVLSALFLVPWQPSLTAHHFLPLVKPRTTKFPRNGKKEMLMFENKVYDVLLLGFHQLES